MSRLLLATAVFACLIGAAPVSLEAQGPDSSATNGKMDDHMMGPWKEMNDFHRVLGATWHPASQKGDMIPLRARAKELRLAADAWAASKAPEMVPSCTSEGVRRMVNKVAHESKAIVAMLDAQVDDTWLMAQFKRLHSSFEAAEGQCGNGDKGR